MRARYFWIGAGSLTAASLLFGSLGASALLAPAAAAAPPPRVDCWILQSQQCLDCPSVTENFCRVTCEGTIAECLDQPVQCDPSNPNRKCKQVTGVFTGPPCPLC